MILRLISFLYGYLMKLRVFLYETGVFRCKKLPCMVISVGNITLGGSGKTPAVISLAEMALKAGYNPAILIRGYKGKGSRKRSKDFFLRVMRGEIELVSDGERCLLDPFEAGDEAYLLAERLKGVPVIKGRKRSITGKCALQRFNSDLLILDDGFQHLSIHRDLNILLVDSTNPFGNRYIFPAGILREPMEAIKRADIIIFTKVSPLSLPLSDIEVEVRRYNEKAPIFLASHQPAGFVDMAGVIHPVGALNGKRVLIFSGIANPASFYETIRGIGCVIVKEIIYPDHHLYKEKDLVQIEQLSINNGAEAVVTTEKDAVKL
ncbi:MAG: tetraacyldisaccharide 4'-kinase, partial [Nitrospirota bacterium]